MNRKSLVFGILTLALGVALGVGGTIVAQKYLFKSSTSTPVASASVAKKSGPLLSIGEFTVNLQGGSFLKTSITLEVANAKAVTLLTPEVAILQDRVNIVLSGKSLSDVQTSTAIEKLRLELIKSLNEVADNQITNVLFPSLVYQ